MHSCYQYIQKKVGRYVLIELKLLLQSYKSVNTISQNKIILDMKR